MSKRGFIDLQVNGFMGTDFSSPDLTLEEIRKVTIDLVERGTVAYCPTVCTSPMEVYHTNLPLLARAKSDPELGGHILGIHLEGPFISPEPGAVGAHRVDCVRPPSVEDFDKFQEWAEGSIAILTLAPERPGAEELIRHASRRGVTVMLGHHLAGRESIAKAIAAGARGCTHVGNGLPNEINRHDNPLWWELASDDLWCMFITDGQHIPAEFIKIALRTKTVDRFLVVSDAAPLAGMPPGIYDGFGKKVEIEQSGRISVCGEGYLAGSHSTMRECMEYLASLNLLSEEELVRVSFANPLELIGRTEESVGNNGD